MAYTFLWMDGFDEYVNLYEKYVYGAEYNTGTGRETSDPVFGYGGRLRMNAAIQAFLAKVLPGAPYQTLFIGFHWTHIVDSTERAFVYFRDEANSLNQMEVRRVYDSVSGTYKFRLYRGPTLLATSSAAVPPSQYRWVSIKCHCDPVAGEVKINIGNTNVLTFTGNTRNGSVSQMHRAYLDSGTAVGTDFKVDNLVIATGAATDPPLPEMRIYGDLVPSANDVVEFTPSAGSNWSNVSQIPPNSANYNYSSTPGQTDLFSYTVPSFGNVIHAVKANLFARRETAGYRTMCPVIKPGTVVREGTEREIHPNAFYQGDIWSVNPDTSAPWTPTEVSGMRFGYRIKS